MDYTNHNLKIKSIQKGWGEHSSFYSVGKVYARIEETLQEVRWGKGDGIYKQVVYDVIDHEGNLCYRIESCGELTIRYYHPKE